MSGRPVRQKLSTTYRAGTDVALAACVLIVACAPAAQRAPVNQPRVTTQQARVVAQPTAIAVDTGFRFGSHPNHGVVVGQFGLDTRGFLVSDPNARGITSLIALTKAESPQAYRMTFGEPEGKEYPFAIALPAGRYYLAHSGASLNVPVQVLTIRTEFSIPNTTTARASFDVVPGVVSCIGRVALELELFMSMRGGTSIVPRGIGVTDTCVRLATTYRSRLRAVSDSMSTRLAVVSR